MEAFSIRFKPALASQLREKATEYDMPVTSYIRYLVESNLQKNSLVQLPKSDEHPALHQLPVLSKRTLEVSLETLYLTRNIFHLVTERPPIEQTRNDWDIVRNHAKKVVKKLLETTAESSTINAHDTDSPSLVINIQQQDASDTQQ